MKPGLPETFRSFNPSRGGEAGSTAIVIVVTKDETTWTVTSANVGDSPVIHIPKEGTATQLSVTHHPGLPEEKSRIESAGGMVTIDRLGNSRVFGVLAVSRAFGDFGMTSFRTHEFRIQNPNGYGCG